MSGIIYQCFGSITIGRKKAECSGNSTVKLGKSSKNGALFSQLLLAQVLLNNGKVRSACVLRTKERVLPILATFPVLKQ
jgi:hypothetical protein